jgi:hypothetical protein
MKPMYSADYYGAELTSILAGTQVNVYDCGGRVRMKRATYTVPAGTIAASKKIALCLIPKNARVIGGAIQHSAMGSGRTLDLGLVGADGTGYLDTGVADDLDMFLASIDVSGAGQDTFAELALGDSNAMYLTAKDCLLVATTEVNTFPAAGTLTVLVKYVVD